MSKLIIEMEMPQNCGECPLLDNNYIVCRATMKDATEYGTERPSWCPIKGELPDEHGRLNELETNPKPTNADYIQAITDEEVDLAIFLDAVKQMDYSKRKEFPYSKYGWFNWVREKAKEGLE